MKPDKEKKLREFLSQLPADLAGPLAVAMEAERLAGRKSLPHDLILEGLRPVLMRAGHPPPRVPTPMRLFCMPFEDLIFANAMQDKQRGRISRQSLSRIWVWLADDLLAQDFNAMVDEIQKEILAGNKKAMLAAATRLHAVAGAALAAALKGVEEGTPDYAALTETLGSVQVVEDARDMALVLEVAPQILKVMDEFPRPIPDFSDQACERLRKHYDIFQEHVSEHLPALFLVLMGRMAKPWQILKAMIRLTGAAADDLLGEGPLAAPGNLLLGDAQLLARYFQSIDSVNGTVVDILRNLGYFDQLVSGIEKALGECADTQWGHWLMVCRKTVGVAIEGHLDQVLPALREALPSKKIGLFGAKGSLCPDTSVWPDEERVELAAQYAAFLQGTQQVAPRQAFDQARQKVVQAVEDYLTPYGDKLIEAIAALDGEDKERADAHLQTLIRLVRLVQSDSAADQLARRALSTAA